MTPLRKAIALLNIGTEPRQVSVRLARSGVPPIVIREVLIAAAARVPLSEVERAMTLREAERTLRRF